MIATIETIDSWWATVLPTRESLFFRGSKVHLILNCGVIVLNQIDAFVLLALMLSAISFISSHESLRFAHTDLLILQLLPSFFRLN